MVKQLLELEHVSSARLDEHGIEVRPGGTLAFGERHIGISDVTVELTDEHTAEIAAIADAALSHMPTDEPTLARALGLPTLLSRVDCTVVDGKIRAYETEDRPAGIYASHKLMTRARRTLTDVVHKHFRNVLGELPTVVHFPSLAANDDGCYLTVVGPDNIPADTPLLMRSKLNDPHMRALHPELVGRTIAPTLREGDKRYRVAMGDALVIPPGYEHDPNSPVTVKSTQCTRANGIGIYLPPALAARYGRLDILSHQQLTKLIAKHSENGGMLAEQYREPIPTAIAGKFGATILRVYVAHIPRGESSVLGGSYVSRPSPLVHGHSDAFAGPVVTEN